MTEEKKPRSRAGLISLLICLALILMIIGNKNGCALLKKTEKLEWVK